MPDSQPLTELACRVEAAEAGSRELDAAVYRALGAHVRRHARMGWACRHIPWSPYRSDHWQSLPRLTSEIDAALALVSEKLPGWFWRAGHTPYGHWTAGRVTHGWAHISRTDASNCNPEDEATGWAATPALALIAALLRALATGDASHE